MGIGWQQLLIVAVIVLILFGRGRISEMMGDFGKGISSFKKGMAEEDKASSSSSASSSPQIEAPADNAPAASETTETTPQNDKTAG